VNEPKELLFEEEEEESKSVDATEIRRIRSDSTFMHSWCEDRVQSIVQ
jgi:hypothetical protein